MLHKPTLAALALLLALALPWTARAAPAPPAFVETGCDLPDIAPAVRPRLRCGTVAVPRDHARPDGGRFALQVVVIASARQPALPDPLVYISGGPGSPLTVYAGYQATHPFAAGRDLVLVDQRGTGRSEPALCPDRLQGIIDAGVALLDNPGPRTQAGRRAAYVACRDQAAADGIDLADFGTPATAEDFDQVRQALGIAQWNVFGVSYGTTVAMTLMAGHPESVRAAVLDSIYPPEPILPPWSRNVADARNAFLAACDRDPDCARLYPDLGGLYAETVQRLARQPPALAMPGTGGRLTAGLFEYVIAGQVYYPRFYPGLPRLIRSVHDGDTRLFAAMLPALLAALTDPATRTNAAATAAVECRDRPALHQPLATDADILDQLSLFGICADWAPPGPPPVMPAGTAIPTLILAGQFDPNARPADSRRAADLLGPAARWIEFPLLGHSVRAFSPCAARIVAEFVDRPGQAPDTACADHPPPIRFLAPAEIAP